MIDTSTPTSPRAEAVPFKYGTFIRNPPGSEYEWTCHTLWEKLNEPDYSRWGFSRPLSPLPRSYRGGLAKVQVSDEMVRVMGFEAAGLEAKKASNRNDR